MRTFRMINTAEQHQISGWGSITTPDAFIPWRGVKVSGIVLFLKLMTLRKIKVFQILVYKILIKFIKSLYSSAVSAVGFKNTKKHSKECFFRLAKSFNCYTKHRLDLQ